MILKTLYREACRVYNSVFRPPNVDMGFVRRERISIAYAISSITFFVLTSAVLFKKFDDPKFVEKSTLKPPPDAKHVKIEFDTKKFTLTTRIEQPADVDKEENSS